jgi:tryptophan-rich sensory protein
MMLFIWAIIAIAVVLSAVLIFVEHEWGFTLGGSTAVILVASYFLADLVVSSPLVVVLPQGSNSRFDAMAVLAALLLLLAVGLIAYLAGRSSTPRKKR